MRKFVTGICVLLVFSGANAVTAANVDQCFRLSAYRDTTLFANWSTATDSLEKLRDAERRTADLAQEVADSRRAVALSVVVGPIAQSAKLVSQLILDLIPKDPITGLTIEVVESTAIKVAEFAPDAVELMSADDPAEAGKIYAAKVAKAQAIYLVGKKSASLAYGANALWNLTENTQKLLEIVRDTNELADKLEPGIAFLRDQLATLRTDIDTQYKYANQAEQIKQLIDKQCGVRDKCKDLSSEITAGGDDQAVLRALGVMKKECSPEQYRIAISARAKRSIQLQHSLQDERQSAARAESVDGSPVLSAMPSETSGVKMGATSSSYSPTNVPNDSASPSKTIRACPAGQMWNSCGNRCEPLHSVRRTC